MDWWIHLVGSPAKQLEVASAAAAQWRRAWKVAVSGETVLPLPQDKRFADPAWQLPPYRGLMQAFLLEEEWWQRATTGVRGVTPHHEQMVSFAARQWLDMAAPSNFVVTNPVVQRQTLQECGLNLFRGAAHALEDAWRDAADLPPAGAGAFEIGRTVAITPGRVVLRNRLMELIQYAPTTPTVHLEPVLIVPAWIMKYYVLDLSPGNSLIRHLVDRGYTVFAISWKNPTSEDRNLGMNDYVELGVRAALQAIRTIIPGAKVHATGYCLGGTLLATVAAALGRTDETPLKTLTLLAAQTDFTAPGELGLFIDEGQVAFLENLMAQRGYLDKKQMQSTFQMLRSNDLIWSYRLQSQLLGQRRPVSDLMAWNADGTRLPARMHSEYLRGMYLNNALARGEWCVDLQAACPDRCRADVRAHHRGHNVGIVNPPGQAKSSYRMRMWHAGDRLLTSRRLAGGDPTGLGHMVDSLGEMAAPTLDTSCGPAVHRSDEAGPAATGCSARPVRARALTRNWRTAHVSTPRELRSPDSGEHDSRGLAWLLRAAAK